MYKSSGPNWKRIFIISAEDDEYDTDSRDEAVTVSKPVNSILASQGKLYLATDSGLFISGDKGETWRRFESAGLGSEKISRALFKNNLYAATDKGVFLFSDKDGTWEALYSGLPTGKINSIVSDNMENIWIATEKGLYRLLQNYNADLISEEEKKVLSQFSHEPGIREVHEIAIKYAEVHPDKIKQWRSAAGKKALLPTVSFGMDRYVTDYWHWDAGQNPDVLQKGDDVISWDVTMKWDLGNLIWSSDQTSIDTRSRLMVQLRGDILDEVTRTYFERRRLMIESRLFPSDNLKEKIDKELRINELTAGLDAMTGGRFSENINP